MTERPIIFLTDMVKAILEDRKTQTRRVIKPQPAIWAVKGKLNPFGRWDFQGDGKVQCALTCPYGKVGDRLWVRETWCVDKMFDHLKPSEIPNHNTTRRYFIDDPLLRYGHGGKWRSPLFMPRWASGILLEITGVRVERVQEITPEDILAEGCSKTKPFHSLLWNFIDLWDPLNAKRGYGWDKNPWVWVINFRRLK